jgi:hypothetical protein
MSFLELLVQTIVDWVRSTIVELLSRGAAEFVAKRRKRKKQSRSSEKRNR